MSGPLAALATAYDKRRGWTLSLPHLGKVGCVRHAFPKDKIPVPEISEVGSQTKHPHFVCLEIADEDGVVQIVPLKGPCSWPTGAKFARDLIRLGAHPLDIIVASADVTALAKRGDGELTWKFTTSVDQLYWTHEDQARLEHEDPE